MSGTNISVAAGRVPTQLSGAPFKHGATVYNNDSTLAVWISDTPSTSIGNGYQIGPLGSILWQSERPPWAIVGNDLNGVLGTTPVLLTVSDNIQEPVNPVSNAVAINLSGIPVTAKTIPVWRDANGNPTTYAPGTSTPMLDVSQYSTLIFTSASLSGPPFHAKTAITVAQYTSTAGGLPIAQQTFGATDSFTMGYALQLVGGAIQIINSGHSDFGISMTAAVSTRVMKQGFIGTAGLSAGSAIIERSVLGLPGTGSFGQSFVTNGGSASMRIFANGVAGKFYLGLEQLIPATGTSDFVNSAYPWGPFNGTGGVDEFWYPDIYIPPGMWRYTWNGPAAAQIDIQTALIGSQ